MRTAPTVQLCARHSADPTRAPSLVLRGIMTCGSVHSCPTCAAPIMARRGEELQQAVGRWGRDRSALVTLTLRHHAGVPLVVLRTLLGRAYSEMWAGSAGRALRAELGLMGHVRAAEQTWGAANGWHPHLHCLFFFEARGDSDVESRLSSRWSAVVRQIHGRLWRCAVRGATTEETPELRARCAQVLGAQFARAGELRAGCERFLSGLRKLGGLEQALPDREHGVRVDWCNTDAAGTYLAKLGCELTGIEKRASGGHYTHWQLAERAAAGEGWAQELWREHSRALKGARHLTWSRGLRARLGLDAERPDSVLAAELEAEPGDTEYPLTEIPAEQWDACARSARQLFVASLFDAFRDGDLPGLDLNGAPRRLGVESAPVWWERLDRDSARRRAGARAMNDIDAHAECRQPRRYISRADRELELEELTHHLALDLGAQSRPHPGRTGMESPEPPA